MYVIAEQLLYTYSPSCVLWNCQVNNETDTITYFIAKLLNQVYSVSG